MTRHFSIMCVLGVALLAGFSDLGVAQDNGALNVGPDGAIAMPAFDFPPSNLASPEMSASIRNRILLPRANEDVLAEWVKADKEKYPVTIEASHIAGVPVVIYTPKAGIAPRNKGLTLIDVHGGGFSGCFDECGPRNRSRLRLSAGSRSSPSTTGRVRTTGFPPPARTWRRSTANS